MYQRIDLIIIFLISLGIGLIIHRIRKKNPTILNHIIKIIFDAVTTVSGVLIVGGFLQVKDQQMDMMMVLIAIIICFQIIIETVNEPIKLNKIILTFLLVFPIIGIYYANMQYKSIYNAEQISLKKNQAHSDYVDTTHKRNFILWDQQNNNLKINQEKTIKVDDFILIHGNSTPNIYIYGENAITHKQLFLVKTNNVGNFTVKLDKKQLAGSFKINLFVNHIALQDKRTVVKESSASVDKVLDISGLPTQTSISDGTYVIGTDLAPGNYVILSNKIGSIQWLSGDNVIKSFAKNLYIDLKQNDVIRIQNAELLKISPEINMVNGAAINGMLKVGTDILPGKYQLEATDSVNDAKVYSTPLGSHTSTGKSVTESVTLQKNDYIYITNNKLVKK